MKRSITSIPATHTTHKREPIWLCALIFTVKSGSRLMEAPGLLLTAFIAAVPILEAENVPNPFSHGKICGRTSMWQTRKEGSGQST
ncbi:MAG: hypothetical protein HFH10_11670 [Dorea sp.]|nr:hypothetical protein [Dorea sp.]